jgi:hypothetical protein
MGSGLASRKTEFFILLAFLGLGLAALHVRPPAAPFGMLLATLGAFAAALALLRHWQMALSAALAPLPGALWFGAAPYALCVALAILMTASFQMGLLTGGKDWKAMRTCLPSLAATLVFAGLWALHAPAQLGSFLASALAVLVLLPALIFTIALDEDAIAKGNRQRELLLRAFVPLAEPRWTMSFAGAGLLLALLGYLEISRRPPAFDWWSCALIALIVAMLSRDARNALAALGVSVLLLLYTGGVGGAQLLFLLLVCRLAHQAASRRGGGETALSALLLTVEDMGPQILFAGLAAMIAASLRGGLQPVLHAACAVVGSLILFPAFTGALYVLFPGRRSLEDRYRPNP